MHRAYSILDIKSIDAEQRIIRGIASSASVDRMGDVVEPSGAEFKLPIPLLWQHDARQPIGNVTRAKVVGDVIQIEAQIARIDAPGQLKDRLDMAWQSIASKLVRGLSIGFQPLEESYDKARGGYNYLKWMWLELSAVTIPANADANIQMIKSLDVGLAATGRTPARIYLSGASDATRIQRTDRSMKKSYADQIVSWENTRAAKQARQEEIQTIAQDAGRAKDSAEKEEFDTIADELKGIDSELVDLRALEAREKAAAVPVATGSNGVPVKAGTRIQVSRELPAGILFARYAMCMGASQGIAGEAMRLAKEHYPDDPGIYQLIQKTAVAGGATTGSHYLDDMVPYNVMNDFINYLRPGSIVGKFGGPNPGGGGNYPSLNKVGFNQRVSGMSTGYAAAWTGEGLPALPSAAVTFNKTLLFHKVAALAVLTKEAIRFTNPAAEEQVRNDLAKAINYRMDYDFVDPANSGTTNLKPAAITDSVVATTPTGTGATNVRKDLASMLASFASNNLDPADICLIMSAQMALQLSLQVNTLGNNEFPDISMKGGSLRGFPVIVSEVLTSVGSPSTQTIIAVKAGEIYLADDGVVTVEASDQASVEMVDTSSTSGISGTGASLVSLWQNGLVGLKATREVTWKLRRTTAVQYISPAAYVAG